MVTTTEDWPLSERQRNKLMSIQRTETHLLILGSSENGIRFSVPARFDKRGRFVSPKAGNVDIHGRLSWLKIL